MSSKYKTEAKARLVAVFSLLVESEALLQELEDRNGPEFLVELLLKAEGLLNELATSDNRVEIQKSYLDAFEKMVKEDLTTLEEV